MGGGAWPFLVGGAICLVNSDNERDSGMLTSYATPERSASPNFLEGQVAFSHPRLSNNRSVMPLDVLGRTRATLINPTSPLQSRRDAVRGQTRTASLSSIAPGPIGPGNLCKFNRAGDRSL